MVEVVAPRTKVIGWDTETYLFRRGRKTPRLVCLTTFADGASEGKIFDRRRAVNRFARMLRVAKKDRSVVLVAHRLVYDLCVMVAERPSLLPLVWKLLRRGQLRCTWVRAKLIAIGHDTLKWHSRIRGKRKFSLAELVMLYFGVDLSADKTDPDAWRLRYHELDGVPIEEWPPKAVRYAVDDAEWAVRVFVRQRATEPAEGLHMYDLDTDTVVDEIPQICAAFALELCSVWGMRTDRPVVEETIKAWEEAAAAGIAVGEEAGFIRAKGRDKGKPGSVDLKKLQALVAEAYTASGRPVPRNPPTKLMLEKDPDALGNVKYSEAILVDSMHTALVEYSKCLTARLNLSKYAETLRMGLEYALTSSPNVIVGTGRTSWGDPPLQGPPKLGRFRECHIPRPGFLYVSCDYDAIEMAALAQTHIDWGLGSTMADAINADKDLHTLFASDTEGISYAEGLALKVAEDEVFIAARDRAKAGNFGFGGGMGALTFVKTFLNQGGDIWLLAPNTGTLDEAIETAKALKAAWLITWPEMVAYFSIISDATQFGSFTAEQAVSGRRRGGCGYTDGCNTYFQGRVADGAKAALVELSRQAYTVKSSPVYGVRPVLFLHDEIIAEVPEDRLTEAADGMARIMREEMERYIPDVKIGCEPAAMRRWYKRAKTVRAKDGTLLPWSPS